MAGKNGDFDVMFNFTEDGQCVGIVALNYLGHEAFQPWKTPLNTTIFVLFTTYFLLSSIAFLYQSSRSPYLKTRGDKYLLLCFSFGAWTPGLVILREAIGRENWPCIPMLIFNEIFLAITAVPFIIRLNKFYLKSEIYKKMANVNSKQFEEERKSKLNLSSVNSESDIQVPVEELNFIKNLHGKASDIQSFKYFMYGLAIPVILIIIQICVYEQYYFNCIGCDTNQVQLSIYLVESVILAIGVLKTYWKVKDTPDPLSFIQEIRYGIISLVIFGSGAAFLAVIDINDLQALGYFSYVYVLLICMVLVQYFQIILPTLRTLPQFAPIFKLVNKNKVGSRLTLNRSKIYSSKDGGDNYDEAEKLLLEMLDIPDIRSLFEEFLIFEWSSENLRFFDAVESFKKKYSTEADQNKKAAMGIFNLFIKPGALLEINIPFTIRSELETLFEDDLNSEVKVDVFDAAQRECLYLLTNDARSRFVLTAEFNKYILDHPAAEKFKVGQYNNNKIIPVN